MDNFFIVAKQVWILFALIGAGALCRKTRLVDENSVKGIVNVLVIAVTPCLIVQVFQRPFEPEMLRQLGLSFLVAILAHMTIIALSGPLGRNSGEKRMPVVRLAMVFSNAGFMGIPLEQAILGDKGVFFGITYVAVFNLFMWSWGLKTMLGSSSGREGRQAVIRTMIVNPGTVGLATGLTLFLFSIRLPEVVATPVSMMASMNTPLAMLVIGYYLAGAKLGPIAQSPEAYLVAFVRLVAYPLALIACLIPFRGIFERDMMLALVTAASAPVAAMVAMFAAKYGRDVDLSVGLVSGTTLLSMLTMPVIIALAMSLIPAI